MSEPRIEVDLTVRHRPDLVVEASFASDGPVVGLFGPSGAGKTTVLEAVAGLVPARGRVRIGDRVLQDDETGIDRTPGDRRVGYVPQDPLLFPHRTVRGNLLFGRRSGPGTRDDLEEVARILEVEELLDRPPRTLSGGETRRVAVGRAVLADPDLLLLDEPFSGLDDRLKDRLRPFLARVRRTRDLPAVYVSHDARDLRALADEVCRISDGHIVARGPVGRVLGPSRDADGHLAVGAAGTDDPVALLRGRLVGRDGPRGRVETGGREVHAFVDEGIDEGVEVRLEVPASSVALAPEPVPEQSPRNQLAATVRSIDRTGGRVLVDLDAGFDLLALVTDEAADELDLAPGRELTALLKATAIRIL